MKSQPDGCKQGFRVGHCSRLFPGQVASGGPSSLINQFQVLETLLVICARQHLCQVVKIAKSGSAEGISLTGTLLELAAITVSGAYNFSQGFPFR